MSSDFVRALLIEQRTRLVSSIMSHAEREFTEDLTPKQRKEFRDKVLSSVGIYHDTCLDMLKASVNDGSVVNGEALSLLRDIHSKVGQ